MKGRRETCLREKKRKERENEKKKKSVATGRTSSLLTSLSRQVGV
jgi:hypothetical protein